MLAGNEESWGLEGKSKVKGQKAKGKSASIRSAVPIPQVRSTGAPSQCSCAQLAPAALLTFAF
jgi:hypothetical protein